MSKKITLRNPENGADINSVFCAAEDEKRDAKQNVTNAQRFTFVKDSEMEMDEKTALWAMKVFGFLTKVKEVEEIVQIKVVETSFEEDEQGEFRCACGRVCKNKLGLMAHERHCKK